MRQTTHNTEHKTAGPLADAGPYTYDLPAVRDDVRLMDTARLAAEGGKHTTWIRPVAFFALFPGAQVVHEMFGLPTLHAYVAVYCLICILEYWDSPKPRQGFVSWTLKVIGVWLNGFVGFVSVPQSLRGLLPDELAFGLPAFLVMLVFYWLPFLKRDGVRPSPWRYFLVAAGLAILWAFLGPAIVK
jgi:hypothetical protein